MSTSSCERQNPNNTYGVQLERLEDKQRKLQQRKTSSAPSLVNVDDELRLLQDRLQFAPNVEPFKLAVPGRHIVYSGELCFVDGWKWVKAWVVLMNDLMIIAEDATTDRVLVIAQPVHMANVLSAEFNYMHRKYLSHTFDIISYYKASICAIRQKHYISLPKCNFLPFTASEFVLILNEESNDQTSHMRTITFRASHPDVKTTWRHLLEQRVSHCHQREYSL